MKKFSLYFMAYSQGKFFGNMLAMDNEQWFNRVCKIPSNLKDWLHYEIDDRDPAIPYSAHHEHAPENCIQILPNIEQVKILQQAKDSSNTSWKEFYKFDVENWKPIDTAIYTLHQDHLQDWKNTQQHLLYCSLIYNLYIDYNLAKEYFDVYWQAHRHLFSK